MSYEKCGIPAGALAGAFLLGNSIVPQMVAARVGAFVPCRALSTHVGTPNRLPRPPASKSASQADARARRRTRAATRSLQCAVALSYRHRCAEPRGGAGSVNRLNRPSHKRFARSGIAAMVAPAVGPRHLHHCPTIHVNGASFLT